jgi:tRNA A-37 threonylcarbamoyl transferase component Bud32
MTALAFAEDTPAFFEEFGLKRFEDFFHFDGGTVINRNRNRDVVAFTLGTGEARRSLFMKRFFHPHFKDMLFALRSFGRVCSQAGCEWHNAGFLLQNGIATYRPLCCGEQMVMGLERRSFLITEKLAGRCLSEFVAQTWDRTGRYGKEAVMAAMGRFVRKIHNADISVPDLYVWHLFMEAHDEGYGFAIIDLHRMRAGVANDREKMRNLGALEFSMSEEYFDEALKDVFYESYFGTDFRGDKALFRQKVRTRRDVLARRRGRPVY